MSTDEYTSEENTDQENEEFIEEVEETEEEESVDDDRKQLLEELKKKDADIAKLSSILKRKNEGNAEEAPKKQATINNDDKYDIMSLKIEGIKVKDDQDFVLNYARTQGISVDEALNTSFVKRGLEIQKEERKQAEASQIPTNRISKSDPELTVKRAYEHYKKTGEIKDGLSITEMSKLSNLLKNKG